MAQWLALVQNAVAVVTLAALVLALARTTSITALAAIPCPCFGSDYLCHSFGCHTLPLPHPLTVFGGCVEETSTSFPHLSTMKGLASITSLELRLNEVQQQSMAPHFSTPGSTLQHVGSRACRFCGMWHVGWLGVFPPCAVFPCDALSPCYCLCQELLLDMDAEFQAAEAEMYDDWGSSWIPDQSMWIGGDVTLAPLAPMGSKESRRKRKPDEVVPDDADKELEVEVQRLRRASQRTGPLPAGSHISLATGRVHEYDTCCDDDSAADWAPTSDESPLGAAGDALMASLDVPRRPSSASTSSRRSSQASRGSSSSSLGRRKAPPPPPGVEPQRKRGT